jgi:hypothetical protein
MPATTVTATKVTRAGVAISTQAADQANGNQLLLSGFEYIRIVNGDASPRSVTFVAQAADARGNKTNKTVSITNGTTRTFGPFSKADWADSNGYLQITWSAGTTSSVTMEIGQNLTSNPSVDTES